MCHLLIIDLPGGNDVDLLVCAINRGDRFTFVTSDLSLYQRDERVWSWVEKASEILECKNFDPQTLDPMVHDAHERDPFDALLCLIDIRLIDASRLASALGLAFLKPDSVKRLRDKHSVRAHLQSLGHEQPPFALATNNAELQALVAQMGLPVLIKPSDGYGSQNIFLLQHEWELDELITPLKDMLPMMSDYGLGVISNDRTIVERYMAGAVWGCDVFTLNGEHQLLGVHEKQYFDEPSFAIRGGTFNPNRGQFKALEKHIFAWLDALDFNTGASHIEVVCHGEGFQLIEINARLVGAKLARLVSYSLGFNVLSALIDLHLGRPLRALVHPLSERDTRVHAPFLAHPSPQFSVSRWISADDKSVGLLNRVIQPKLPIPGVKSVEIMKKRGDWIRPPMENADRIGLIVASAADKLEAEQSAEQYLSMCTCVAMSPPDLTHPMSAQNPLTQAQAQAQGPAPASAQSMAQIATTSYGSTLLTRAQWLEREPNSTTISISAHSPTPKPQNETV
jgi:biotin carboxylase